MKIYSLFLLLIPKNTNGDFLKMEMILGVIEDALDHFEGGTDTEKEDAKNELKMNYDEFVSNLTPLAENNPKAKELLDRLKSIEGNI